jgi:hypothetical protein
MSRPSGYGSLRRELLDRVLILGEQHLQAVLTGYQAHYNTARPHQGIAQHVPDDERDGIRAAVTDIDIQQVRRKPILNGLINEYTRGLRDGTPAGHQANPIFERDRVYGVAGSGQGPGSGSIRVCPASGAAAGCAMAAPM